MSRATKMLAHLALVSLFAPVLANDASPIQKVLEMISGLEGKIIKEGETSQKTYEAFAEYCEDRARELGFEIKTGETQIADLSATIEKETADISALSTKIEELAASIASDEKDLQGATEVRAKENADFSAEDKELTETIDTINRAISVIEREMQKGSASFVQMKSMGNLADALSALVKASALTSADASKLTALVQSSAESDDSDSDDGAPDAAVYTSHSGGIIETLENLVEKADGQLAGLRKTENTAQHNFDMLKQSLDDSIKFGNKDMGAAKKSNAECAESKATAEGDLSTTKTDLAEDVKAKADLHHDCLTRATNFEEETKSRGEELNALAKAKEIISEMTGGAASQSYDLAQVSFAQIDSIQHIARDNAASQRVMKFVRHLAQKQSSPALTQLASRMASVIRFSSVAGDDVFAKVKDLINSLLVKLEKEAKEDATKKGFCDKELKESNEKKDDKQADVEKLSTKIDLMTADSAKLKEEVAELQKELADLASATAEMQKMRGEEKASYNANKPELEQGIKGVQMALKVLKDYYASDKSHDSADGAGSGIIGLLEVAESDFTKGLAEMIAEEEAAQSAFDQESQENKIVKATKEKDVQYKSAEAKSLDKAVTEATSDRDGVQTELDAVLEYLAKLNDQCVAKPETYAERKSRREAEVSGLKEALSILEGVAFVQEHAGRRTLRGIAHHA